MTVAIAAISDDETLVIASDMMISYGDDMQATESAAVKGRQIAQQWMMLFSADKVDFFIPLVRLAREKLGDIGGQAVADAPAVRRAVQAAYQEIFDSEFTAENLAKFRFASTGDFMARGLAQFGKDLFADMVVRLDKFDLGVTLLVCGIDTQQGAHIFTVENPGTVRDCDLLKYAVIGTGSSMASAAIRRKPIRHIGMHDLTYRVLEAKFSAETASGVGKQTFFVLLSKDGRKGYVSAPQVDEIRREWQKTVDNPPPSELMSLIREGVFFPDSE